MLTLLLAPGYSYLAAAKSAVGFGDPEPQRRTSATKTGAFFASVCYGGCAWETSGSAGFLCGRFANLRTAAPILFGDSGDGSSHKGASPMRFPTRSPSARAAAHRAMARSALFSDSSAAVRLKRYNAHMDKARTLEATAKEVRA